MTKGKSEINDFRKIRNKEIPNLVIVLLKKMEIR